MRGIKWLKNLFTGRAARDVKHLAVAEVKKKAADMIESPEFEEMLGHTLKQKIVGRVNEKINLPVLNEEQEAVLFSVVYDAVKMVGVSFIRSKL